MACFSLFREFYCPLTFYPPSHCRILGVNKSIFTVWCCLFSVFPCLVDWQCYERRQATHRVAVARPPAPFLALVLTLHSCGIVATFFADRSKPLGRLNDSYCSRNPYFFCFFKCIFCMACKHICFPFWLV